MCAEEAKVLRSVLDKHPHWERVLELWNRGETESVIAEALQIKVTQVRSATQRLRMHGFDLLSGERRNQYAASHGRAGYVPKVRLNDPACPDGVSPEDNIISIHHDP